jgi:hypothetical protein
MKPIKDKKTKNTDASITTKIKNFNTLKKDYELVEEHLTINSILRKMSETLELYLKMIQQILQPEEFHALHECSVFDDKDKIKLFDLYKSVIIVYREVLKAEIINEEKNTLSTIQLVHEEIRSVKPQMLAIADKMQGSWKRDIKKDNQRYFG